MGMCDFPFATHAHVMIYISADPLLLELTISDLARRVEATEAKLDQALRRILALEEQLAKEQPNHHVQDTPSTGASVHPPTPTRPTIHPPKPLHDTVRPTSAQSTSISTPVPAGMPPVDISTPASTRMHQLSYSPPPSSIHLPGIYEGVGSSNSPLEVADGCSPYEPSYYPADSYAAPSQGS